jgi:SpoVK/Ycf46/Vps4 family AAA+-type ATPase
MRLAIQTIEAVGQCVVHIDELEKALAGSDGHGGDGGVTRRILGNFLEWTQEHTCPAFIVATMNSRIGVPPELLRRGRWDQLFFIGPPSLAEREAIFKIHIYKRGRDWRDLSNFNINELAKATDKFSGAEIEAAVIDGMYNAFDDGKDLRNEHILQAIRLINPLARSSSEELEAMVQWSKENAINASECEDENSGRKLDV